MRQISEVTDALLLDLARKIVSYRVRAAERSLTDAIEDRRTAPGRLAWLRGELDRGRAARTKLFSIPEVP